MSEKRGAKSSTFLQDHTVMHELISMNNGKYIIWKMRFPRVDDTFVTADKLLDLWVWKELYNVLTRITVQYNDSTSLVKQLIGSSRYELSFNKIQMPVECIRDLFDVDINLIREILCVNLVLNTDYHQSYVNKLANAQSNSAGPSKNLEKSVNVSTPTKQRVQKRPFSALQEQTDDDDSVKAQPKMDSLLVKTHFMNDDYSDSSTELSIQESSTEKSSPESVSLDAAIKRKTKSLTNQSQSAFMNFSSSESSSDEISSIESSASKIRKIDTSATSTLTDENVDIPKNLQELRILMNDRKYLEKFGFEDRNEFRLFDDIYTVDGDICYAAFCSTMTMQHIQGRRHCKLFFYFSQELLGQFNSFSEVTFAGVNHILMVFVNFLHEELSPIGFFLLPNKKEALQNVPRIINGWLNGKGSRTIVTKCITPYDELLQVSIAEVWPSTKILGCSVEYQKEVKLFAKENKGMGAEHKTKLTRLACSLCYLEEKYIPVGINVIKVHSKSDYGTMLVKHLKTKWLGLLKSVNGEKIIYRSLDICQRFSKKVERDNFSFYGKRQYKHRHVWDFFKFLKSLTSESETHLSRLVAGAMPENNSFGCNTTLQKEKENRIADSINEFDENIEEMTEFKAVERFMLQMLANV